MNKQRDLSLNECEAALIRRAREVKPLRLDEDDSRMPIAKGLVRRGLVFLEKAGYRNDGKSPRVDRYAVETIPRAGEALELYDDVNRVAGEITE